MSRAVLIRSALFVALVVLTACSSPDKKRKRIVGPTLAEIPELSSDIQPSTLERDVTLEKVEEFYQRALDAATDEGTRRTILIRLADVLMLRSEEQMFDDNETGEVFNEAIERYRELIALQKQTDNEDTRLEDRNSKEVDQMLYQLSKAYALSGQVESSVRELSDLAANYEGSAYSPEAKFRSAEQAFSNGKYAEAEQLYLEVIGQGTFTPYYQNAIYMYGWSQFKQYKYQDAVASFTKVMDHLYGRQPPLKKIAKSQQNLVDDTLRVMSLSFSYLDGPESLSASFKEEVERPYVFLIYQALGELYFKNERYRDSANAYRQYVMDNPLGDKSPMFSRYIIDVYDKGNFPSLLIPAKEEYIINYGIDSEFWQIKPQEVRDELSPKLKLYLEELAKYEHAIGQGVVDVQVDQGPKKTPQEIAEDQRKAYLKAAVWYDQYVRTFPTDLKTPDMLFLLGESLFEAKEYSRSFDAYARLAYDFPLPEDKKAKGADAGYSAILITQKQVKTIEDPEQLALWQIREIDQSLAFAEKYAADKRAPSVLATAAEKLLKAERQPEAIAAAKRLTEWQPPADRGLQRGAWLVVGQSEFDLENYAGADEAFGQALLLTDANDPSRQSIVDRQAASVYKYAENLLAQGDQQGAVNQFLRVQVIAPDTEIAITAQYDAGNQFMEMKRWQQAENIFLAFRQKYPKHPLTKTLYAKLVLIYQESEQWIKAGNELTQMATVSDDPEMRRQSLLLAGELYEKSGQVEAAITSNLSYIQRYPAPLDDAVETMNKLGALYRKQKNIAQYEYWLNQMVIAHDKAGNNATERSLYLAATATNYQAKKSYQNFARIRLTLPLKTSLARKKEALAASVATYNKVIDYGVLELVTEANYFLGELYVRLRDDLLDSERPKGLDTLASEQYDMLLEDQTYSFEDKAIELHKSNIARVQDDVYDDWIKRSYQSLAKLIPGQFDKLEGRSLVRELY